MKRNLLFLFLIFLICISNNRIYAWSTDTVFVRETGVPILIDRIDNELFHIRINASNSKTLDNIHLTLGPEIKLDEIAAIKLYYGGTECIQKKDKNLFASTDYVSAYTPGKTRIADPSYSILNSIKTILRQGKLYFKHNKNFSLVSTIFGSVYK